MAECVAQSSHGRLLDLSTLNLEILEQGVSGAKEYLRELERLHKALILYLWLGYRFGGIFTDRTLATHVKGLVEERMMRALTEFSVNKKLRRDSSLKRQIALQKQQAEQEGILGSDLLQQGEDEHETSTLEGSPEAPGASEESVEEGFLETAPSEEAEPSKGTQSQTS
jgi:ATP-dependent RNA helicase SUPV3L1/SUV3